MNEPNLTGQSATEELNENDTFSALAQAMSKGDHAEIDRLMAVEDGKDPEDNVESQDEVDPQLDLEDSSSDSEDADNGAAPAAQTEQNQNTVSTPAEIEAMKAELHRLRSDVGRVGHLQRTVQELQRQARAFEEARAGQAQVDKPTQPKPKELPEDLQKRITALKEVDPELADTFEAFAKAMSQETDARANEVRQTFEDRQREQEEARHWQEQKAELYKLVPRCDEVFAMPEWQEWKETLTPGERGLTESGYARDMAHAIYGFASYMQARQQAYNPTHQAASSEGGDPNQSNANAATNSQAQVNNEVNDTRARKVGAAADVRSTAAKKVEALDEQKLYEEYYNQIGRANHILPSK